MTYQEQVWQWEQMLSSHLPKPEQAASERAGVLELGGGAAQTGGDDASERVAGAAAGRQDVGVAAETAGMVL